MSQHDFNIANQTFPSFRADLNNALVAAATMSAGSSAPTTPYPYQLWFDTTTGTWKVRNSGNTAWVSTITTDLATGNVNISGSSGATLKLTSTDTSGADTELLGQIDFVSSDVSGGSAGTQARIKGVYEDNGDSSGLAFLTGASTGSGSPTLNEVMRIRHEGRVGIGTSSPNEKVTINGSFRAASQDWQMQILNPDTAAANKGGGIAFGGSYTGAVQTYFSNILGAKENGTDGNLAGYLSFYTRSSGAGYTAERMRISSSGNVGIGTSSAQSIVHIDQGASDDAQLTLETHSAGDSKMVFSQGPTAGNWAVGYDDGGGVTENSLSFAYKSDGYPSLSGQNKMILTPAGTLGIGHATPQFGLTIAQGNGNESRIGWEDGSENKRASIICASSSDALQFHTGTADTERMRIDNSGRILCGTTDTDVFNNTSGNGINIKGSAGAIEIANTSGETLYLNRMGTDGRIVNIRKSGTFIGGIDVTTSAVSYNTSSDYRLKTAVNYDWDATSRLKQLKPARFAWIVDGDDAVPVDGFLAHEVSHDSDGNPLVPEAITGTKDGMRDEEYQVSAATGDIYTPAVAATYDDDGVELTAAVDEVIHSADVERPEELAEGQLWRETTAAVMGTRSVPDYQGIDQSKLTPLLTKALIEAVEKIEQLEARITALEAN